MSPIVMELLLALGFSGSVIFAFVMSAGFISDAANLPLTVSNLVNILSADYFGLGFRDYASVMLPVDIVAIASSLLVRSEESRVGYGCASSCVYRWCAYQYKR